MRFILCPSLLGGVDSLTMRNSFARKLALFSVFSGVTSIAEPHYFHRLGIVRMMPCDSDAGLETSGA